MGAKYFVNAKKTIYCKLWQSNGYYPIVMYKYRENIDEYEHWVWKSGRWYTHKSWGTINKVELLYFFEHNACILSHEEMTDREHYNDDNEI